jgi:hypothetical protein
MDHLQPASVAKRKKKKLDRYMQVPRDPSAHPRLDREKKKRNKVRSC